MCSKKRTEEGLQREAKGRRCVVTKDRRKVCGNKWGEKGKRKVRLKRKKERERCVLEENVIKGKRRRKVFDNKREEEGMCVFVCVLFKEEGGRCVAR